MYHYHSSLGTIWTMLLILGQLCFSWTHLWSDSCLSTMFSWILFFPMDALSGVMAWKKQSLRYYVKIVKVQNLNSSLVYSSLHSLDAGNLRFGYHSGLRLLTGFNKPTHLNRHFLSLFSMSRVEIVVRGDVFFLCLSFRSNLFLFFLIIYLWFICFVKSYLKGWFLCMLVS